MVAEEPDTFEVMDTCRARRGLKPDLVLEERVGRLVDVANQAPEPLINVRATTSATCSELLVPPVGGHGYRLQTAPPTQP